MRILSGLQRKNSGELAKDRLRLILIADKTDCSPGMIEMVKEDLAAAVSRYMEIDRRGIQIQIREETAAAGRKIPALYANIPILHMGNKGTF
ncbi:MAG TPA: cell division topological specificity factor MinE [Candidatus Lachnoclostridium pullistercoris]|uniref:Cell division topological specificity factor n=1 Tax=Candidatus Lachnoclostridium pullistercoris TaxID=2838632 RepID=A0A9D2PDY1_9FIRM|nr:cell division topological specificity factor MinE [Candidatus Lachnoclostridium pullistercoris]